MNYSQDITFCSDECQNTECNRHYSHILQPQLPHSVASFQNTEMCPLHCNMELGNFLFGNSRGRYHIKRFPAEDWFADFLKKCKLNHYGHPKSDSPLLPYQTEHGIDTDLFIIFPYYWGDEEEKQNLSNFVYKPENIEVQWYKYPFRDAYSNIELTDDKIKEIITKCQQFVETLPS